MHLSNISILRKFKTVFQTGTAHHPVRIHLSHRVFGDVDLTSIQSSSTFNKANAFYPIMKYMDMVTNGHIQYPLTASPFVERLSETTVEDGHWPLLKKKDSANQIVAVQILCKP